MIIWFEGNKNIVNITSVQNWFKSFGGNCLTSFIPWYDINLLLVLPYFGVVSLQIRTKLQQVFKRVLNCCKLEIAFKCQTKLSNSFQFKDPILKDLISGVVINFSAVSEINESCYGNNILYCNYLPSFDNSSNLAHGNKKFLFEIKESLLIKRDKTSLNRNISSALFYLFYKVY